MVFPIENIVKASLDSTSKAQIIFGIDFDELATPIDSVFNDTSTFSADFGEVGFLGAVGDEI